MSLAPIGLSTYSRLTHLQQTVQALQANSLARESELYVFSDGPKPGDEARVRAVREFLNSVDGFKRVEVWAREGNSRTYNNRQGIRALLDKFGKMIFLEEDVVTAPAFLDYMNQALDAYETNPRIFSIAGYCPPIPIPADYPHDVFFHPRFHPWGCGLWKSRLDMVEMRIPAAVMKGIFLKPGNLKRFGKGGMDMLPLALNNYFEYVDGLDVRLFTQQFALNMLTVYPVRHMVDNIGLDGSGLHQKRKPTYRVRVSNEAARGYSMPEQVEPDPRITKAYYEFRSGNYLNRARLLAWAIWIVIKWTMGIRPRAAGAQF